MANSSSPGPVKDTGARAGDYRIWLRFPSRVATFCQSAGSDHESGWSAQVHDVSRKGLKLLAARKFKPGTVIKIGVADGEAGEGSVIVARVGNVTATPEGKWTMDCAFLKELSEGELVAWLKEKS